MLLSVFVTSHYLNAVGFDASASKFLRQKLIKIPFDADNTHPPVSNKVLAKLLSENILEYDKSNLLISTDLDQTYDLTETYSIADISSKIPFVMAVLNHYESNLYQKLGEAAAAEYLNFRKYHIPISFETKKKLDELEIERIMPAMISGLIDSKSIVFSTVEVPKPNQGEYLAGLIKAFARAVPIAGIWRFLLDTDFDIVPQISALLNSNKPIEGNLGLEGSCMSAVLVSAPGVMEVEMSVKEGEKKKVAFEENRINEIRFDESKAAEFQWKSPKSKYKGLISGSSLGILFDNRELNDKN